MGDLEDAIREHLELKRRRGADAGEVAREEHEALAPVTRSHPVVITPPTQFATQARRDDHEYDAPRSFERDDEGSADQFEPAGGDQTQEFRVEDDWLAADADR